MAFTEYMCAVTLQASVDLDSYMLRVVEMDSSGQAALAALSQGYGILFNKPKSGEAGTVIREGRTKGIAGLAVSVGDKLRVQSGGWLIPVNSGAAHPATFMMMGRAITAASSGGIFTVELDPQLMVSVDSGAAVV